MCTQLKANSNPAVACATAFTFIVPAIDGRISGHITFSPSVVKQVAL